MDSNHRRLSRRIYSPLHLAALQPFHMELVKGIVVANNSRSASMASLIRDYKQQAVVVYFTSLTLSGFDSL